MYGFDLIINSLTRTGPARHGSFLRQVQGVTFKILYKADTEFQVVVLKLEQDIVFGLEFIPIFRMKNF